MTTQLCKYSTNFKEQKLILYYNTCIWQANNRHQINLQIYYNIYSFKPESMELVNFLISSS